MTLREAISEIRNNLRTISIDTWIPAKYIHSKLIGKATLFLKRENSNRRLMNYTDIWTSVCFEMVEDDLISCCNLSIPGCTKVMRSKNKLPALYTSEYGYLLNVTAVDYVRDYNPTTPQQYKYIKSREFNDTTKKYFWIDNGYIIVPDSMVSEIKVTGLFINRAEALRLDCRNKDTCIRFLDEEFTAPPHLWDNIKDATTIDIAKIYSSIQPDELANLNANQKASPKEQ